MRIVGIDYGDVRIGISISDESKIIAFPLAYIDGHRDLKKKFENILDGKEIEKFILGNPLGMNGSAGPMSEKIDKLALKLELWFGVECVLWDERYTTALASHAVRKSGGSGRKGENDMASATVILQSYLDAMNRK